MKKTVRRVKPTRKKRKWLGWMLAAAAVVGCVVWQGSLRTGELPLPAGDDPASSQTESNSANSVAERNGYAVSSCSEYATNVACQVLEQGGTAADAAVAMAYALAVAEPYASGLGGGGCLLLYDPASARYYFYDYGAEAAQSGASSTMLVPGFVSGMKALQEDFGTMSYAELLRPAIELCDGVVVNETLAARIKSASTAITRASWFFSNGEPLGAGELLVQQELKQTLQTLAAEGPDCFYTGSIAEQIAAGTRLTLADLAAYETIRTDAVVDTYLEYEVASAAAPFSGTTLIQALKMAELLDLPSPEQDNRAFLEGLRTITMASHQDRVSNVFDYRFSSLVRNEEDYLTDEYLAALLDLDVSGFEDEDESEDTTSFAIIDKNGMVIACTNTLASFFGCKQQVAGFFMNNTGRNFGTGVNAYAAGKRPRSHIAPTILRSGDETIAIATPGGNVIVKVLSAVLIDILQYDTAAADAIAKQRLLFKTPQLIYYEKGYDTPLLASVSGSRYRAVQYNSHSYFGNITYVSHSAAGGYSAIADVRREGYCEYKN